MHITIQNLYRSCTKSRPYVNCRRSSKLTQECVITQQSTGIARYLPSSSMRSSSKSPISFKQQTRTPAWGASNALTWGVGATEYANLVSAGFTFVKVPESIRFELSGSLNEGCTAKDVILHILADHARKELTLNRSMEFGGHGLQSLSADERATLCNMATECSLEPESVKQMTSSTIG